MNSLAESVRVLQGRDLTAEEKNSLIKFQEIYEIADDDPLVVILATLGAHKTLLDSADLLFKKTSGVIELQQQMLQEQSTLISKELIAAISPHIITAVMEQESQNSKYALMFFGGIFSGLGALLIGRLLGYV
jgi:hypothetical protein